MDLWEEGCPGLSANVLGCPGPLTLTLTLTLTLHLALPPTPTSQDTLWQSWIFANFFCILWTNGRSLVQGGIYWAWRGECTLYSPPLDPPLRLLCILVTRPSQLFNVTHSNIDKLGGPGDKGILSGLPQGRVVYIPVWLFLIFDLCWCTILGFWVVLCTWWINPVCWLPTPTLFDTATLWYYSNLISLPLLSEVFEKLHQGFLFSF